MCYLGITNGEGCSRVTCLLGEDRERNTTMYLHSEEYKAGYWVKWLLCYKTKILDFLSQPGNSHAGPDSQIHTSSQAHSWGEVFTHFWCADCRQKQRLPTSKIIRISPFSTSNATLCTCCFSKAPRVTDRQAGGHSFTEEWKSQTWGLLWMS